MNRRGFLSAMVGMCGVALAPKPEPIKPLSVEGIKDAFRELHRMRADTYSPQLYQARTSVNWRAVANDDLAIFGDISKRIAEANQRQTAGLFRHMFGAPPSRLTSTERRFDPTRLPA